MVYGLWAPTNPKTKIYIQNKNIQNKGGLVVHGFNLSTGGGQRQRQGDLCEFLDCQNYIVKFCLEINKYSDYEDILWSTESTKVDFKNYLRDTA